MGKTILPIGPAEAAGSYPTDIQASTAYIFAAHFVIFENMELNKTSRDAPSDSELCQIRCFHPEAVQRIRQTLQADESRLAASAELLKTLGSVKRLTILHALRESELCVCDIAYLLGLSVAATSQQLRQLRGQGWVAMRHDGKMVYYRLREDAPLAHLDAELAALTMPAAATSKQSA